MTNSYKNILLSETKMKRSQSQNSKELLQSTSQHLQDSNGKKVQIHQELDSASSNDESYE